MRSYSLRHAPFIVPVLCVCGLLFFSYRLAIDSFPIHELKNSQQIASQWYGESDVSMYRQRLSLVRPLDAVPHSKTLGVADRLYVVSLPTRKDRRDIMSGLERAMDLDFTWHEATDLHSQDVQDIMERVRWWRNENRVNDSLPKADPSPFKFKWADDIDVQGPLGLSGADLWPTSVKNLGLDSLPPPPSPDTRPPILDSYGEKGDIFGTTPLRPAQISCWHSHYNVLRKIAEGEADVAIVFEDDIDMEWDLERQLRRMWPALPPDWDMVMLGHCHSQEWTHPALPGAPTLHPARHTLCTHAYAVNRRSAQHIVRRLRSEPFAYSRTIDHAIQHLSGGHEIKVFSVYPPIVIQTYETDSDIIPGRDKGRVQWLADSALERIALAEDHERLMKVDANWK